MSAAADSTTRTGSSPHTRGALQFYGTQKGDVRIIPAYAGSTCGWRRRLPFGRDHPRIRGEHDRLDRLRHPWRGSSPHTRGARTCMADTPEEDGIIPAYAGSTPALLRHRLGHPGSSPHTRGALRQQYLPRPGSGIIPAYAGSTLRANRFCAYRRDHPRIRGEHATRTTAWPSPIGSSPHTRGARQRRILSPRGLRDHPRIRGEHSTPLGDAPFRMGSSPHTRGAPLARHDRRVEGGIIPAYAGSTALPPLRPVLGLGSSPHTRGARC